MPPLLRKMSASDVHEQLMKLVSIEYDLAILPVSLSHPNGKAEAGFANRLSLT